MLYVTTRPFKDITGFKEVGEPIELNDERAAKLRRMGLIGGVYHPQVFTAMQKAEETRNAEEAAPDAPVKPRARKKKG